MDIRIKEEGSDVMALRAKIIQWIYQARSAASMKKYSHEKGCLLSGVVL
jgi:hypothetical protein